jgi:hypothetical protein
LGTQDTALEVHSVDSALRTKPDIAGVVRELRELYYVKGMQLMLQIGELILQRLYAGDVTRWRAHNRKDNSFRKLQRHPDLPFKASTLSRAVSMYLLSRRRPDLLQLHNVSHSHLQEVLHLEAPLQDELLRRVQAEKWSVLQLRNEVGHRLDAAANRPGRPRALTFSKQLRSLKSAVDDRLFVTDMEHVSGLERREAQELLETARRLCQQAEVIARKLAAHVATFDADAGDPATATHHPISGTMKRSVPTSQHPPSDGAAARGRDDAARRR